MDKELKKLLNNYVNVIYGKAFPINPTTHQLHLLLDYIANLEQQCKKQKKAIDKAIEFTNKKWGTWCTHHLEYMTELQNILKEVSE